MAIKQLRPTTNARRKMTTKDMSSIENVRPFHKLTKTIKSNSGRNNQGRITIRHRGGGAKTRYRVVDYRLNNNLEYKVLSVEYDPNRSANIALIEDTSSGQKSYIIAGKETKKNSVISSGKKASVRAGNRLEISRIPLGSSIYNIELIPGKGGQIARSAGTNAQLVAREGNMAQVKLPSGEIRLISVKCNATMGSVGNEAHQNIVWGSAGRQRRMGRRPSVRGKAMNPSDHPMGGGEGQSSPGRLPRTPWGKIAIGAKTRKRKYTTKMIVSNRKSGRR